MSQNSENITISRKEREKKTREQEILSAARALFMEKGYHNTTLDEIAHKAEFAKGTIYNYFANKDELFVGIVDSIFDEFSAITMKAMGTGGADVREKFTAYAKAIITHSNEHSDLFRLFMQESPRSGSNEFAEKIKHFHDREKESRDIVARTLSEEIRRGTVKQADPLELAFLFDGMLRFYCMHAVKGLRVVSTAEVDHAAELMVSIFFDGITTYAKEKTQ
jgi:TetR/AcrR family transcriptional regulator